MEDIYATKGALMTVVSPDQVEQLVLTAINAVQSGNRADILAALESLAPVDTGDVLAELMLWVEDLTAGVAQEALLQAAKLPVPPRSEELLKAAVEQNLGMLLEAVDSDELMKVFSSLLVLVAALKDARTRL